MAAALRALSVLQRKKTLQDDVMDTPLRRCLTTVDLTLLGIGHMIGAGIYVLTGTVVRDIAGPGTVLSYLMAGMAATLSSLCYAEFGARVPKAGSAYTYTYVTMGELWAFIIGWNIILEHLLGVASVARAWSGCFDALFNGAIRNGTLEHVGHMEVAWMSVYPDFIALLIVLVVMVFVSVGAKVSANFNSAFTGINLIVILLIISVGLSLGKVDNWNNSDRGGFLPYGFTGVLAGAGSCFYAYIGFEGIAVAGEEAKNPSKAIPVATGVAMGIVTLLYVGTSSSLTLMVPFDHVDVAAPFPAAFEERGMHWARFMVAIGALFGITTSLIGGLFSLPRAVYSMSSDGLLFKIFATVHPRTQTPIVAIVVFGLAAGIVALLEDLQVLVELLSIGTLLSFTLVAASVITLRYRTAAKLQFKLKPEETGEEADDDQRDPELLSIPGGDSSEDTRKILKSSQSHEDIGKLKKQFTTIPILKDMSPGNATAGAVLMLAVFITLFWLIIFGADVFENAQWWAIVMVVMVAVGIAASFLVLLAHEQNKSFLTFQVPFVPWLPGLSMFINIAMMLKLNPYTWIRLGIWLSVGFIIYFLYGIRHSHENRPLATYSQVVNYAGTDTGQSIAGKMDEKVHMQQPRSELQQPNEQEEEEEEREQAGGS